MICYATRLIFDEFALVKWRTFIDMAGQPVGPLQLDRILFPPTNFSSSPIFGRIYLNLLSYAYSTKLK